jgi:threonine-phosphate decarboxylase
LISVCSRRRIYLVLDESFIDFTTYPSRVADAAKHSHVVVVRSLTKFWALAGLRIGYLVAQKALIEKLSARSEPWSINTLASAAAAESLRDVKYRDRTLHLIRRERAFLVKQLSRLAWLETYPSEANFLLVRITAPGVTSTHLRGRLQERNILIRDGSNFPGLGRRYFRIAIRGRSDNQRLIDALHAVSGDAARSAKESS